MMLNSQLIIKWLIKINFANCVKYDIVDAFIKRHEEQYIEYKIKYDENKSLSSQKGGEKEGGSNQQK